jgi:SAM-dependent methyltransferase
MSVRDRRVTTYYRIFGADGVIRSVLRDTDRVLDVGCSVGTGSMVLEARPAFGTDIHLESLQQARAAGRRAPVICADVVSLPFADESYDVVVALDVLEHLDPDTGVRFIAELLRVSARDLIVLTPSGFDPQPAQPDQPWMEHRSGWTAGQLEDLGLDVAGWGGPKVLRIAGSGGRFRLGPVGGLLAMATVGWSRRRPQRSFHLLATRLGPSRDPC